MTVKDVVELSAVYLGLEDVLSTEDFSSSLNATTNPVVESDELTTRSINLLIRCTSLALNDLTTGELCLKHAEAITVNNNVTLLENFSKPVVRIISAYKNGHKIAFEKLLDRVVVAENGVIDFEYQYNLEEKTALTDQLEGLEKLVPLRVIAYAVAKEYCFISGLYEEGNMWEEKEKIGLESLALKKQKKLPVRRWF